VKSLVVGLAADARASNETTVLSDETAEHKGSDGRELDQNVDRGAGGVLKRVTNGVTDDGSLVLIIALLDEARLALGNLLTGALKEASLDVLLGVVPSTTGVGGREGNLDTGNNVTGEEARDAAVAEQETHDDGSQDNEGTRGDHLLEGGVGRDSNALVVLGLHLAGGNEGNLADNLLNHLLSGSADSGHGKSGESVGDHSTEQETGEGEGLEDVDHVGGGVVVGDAGHEGAEESQGDEAGRANSEALADGSGGVTSGIKSISVLADILVEVAHLSNTTSVVRNRAIAINSEADGKAAKHANGTESNTVHSSPVEAQEDSDSEADNGDDVGHVAKGKTLNDVGSGIEAAGTGKLTGGAERVGGVVLSGETDEETGPETELDAAEHLPAGSRVVLVRETDLELCWQHVDAGHEAGGHEEGGDEELGAEFPFNRHLDVHELDADEGSDNAD